MECAWHSPMVKTPQLQRGKVQHGTLGAAKRATTVTSGAVWSYKITKRRYRRKSRRFLRLVCILRLRSEGHTWRACGKASKDRSRGLRRFVVCSPLHSPKPTGCTHAL